MITAPNDSEDTQTLDYSAQSRTSWAYNPVSNQYELSFDGKIPWSTFSWGKIPQSPSLFVTLSDSVFTTRTIVNLIVVTFTPEYFGEKSQKNLAPETKLYSQIALHKSSKSIEIKNLPALSVPSDIIITESQHFISDKTEEISLLNKSSLLVKDPVKNAWSQVHRKLKLRTELLEMVDIDQVEIPPYFGDDYMILDNP
jgi:hypothetical protein